MAVPRGAPTVIRWCRRRDALVSDSVSFRSFARPRKTLGRVLVLDFTRHNATVCTFRLEGRGPWRSDDRAPRFSASCSRRSPTSAAMLMQRMMGGVLNCVHTHIELEVHDVVNDCLPEAKGCLHARYAEFAGRVRSKRIMWLVRSTVDSRCARSGPSKASKRLLPQTSSRYGTTRMAGRVAVQGESGVEIQCLSPFSIATFAAQGDYENNPSYHKQATWQRFSSHYLEAESRCGLTSIRLFASLVIQSSEN
ncbi:hypothetical protein QFZ91_004430 [Paraburkholderia sp. JPY419]